MLQTHGKRHNETIKPTRVIKFTPIKKCCNRNIKKINENMLTIFGYRNINTERVYNIRDTLAFRRFTKRHRLGLSRNEFKKLQKIQPKT